MGYRGMYERGNRLILGLNELQQLLTIWGKARVKERDALLWGDEVMLSLNGCRPS